MLCCGGMELHALQVFLTVANEKSFSRAAEKLFRTQPAISLAVQRLEQEFGEKLIDRSGKDLILTDAGQTVLDYARRFQSLQQELDNSLAELRDNSAGRLTIGANESTTLYLLQHIEKYRELYPKVKVQTLATSVFGFSNFVRADAKSTNPIFFIMPLCFWLDGRHTRTVSTVVSYPVQITVTKTIQKPLVSQTGFNN